MTGDVGLLQGEEDDFSPAWAQNWELQGHRRARTSDLVQSQQPQVIPTIMCKMEND